MEPTQERCLDDLLAARAVALGDAVAVAGLDRPPLTYRQLYTHVTEIVASLNRMGIGRGDRVAIVLPNGPEMAAAFLGVAAGAVSAPLNPAYTPGEFDFYLDDLEAKALVVLAGCSTPACDAARKRAIPVIELAPSSEAVGLFILHGKARAAPAQAGFAAPEDIALVLHTSGTTSRPKMVPLLQSNLCASAEHIRRTLALTPADRCMNVMPLFHIHGLMAALLASLAAGASVFCTPGFDSAQFFRWMQIARPTWYSAVPTMHQAMLSQAGRHPDVIAANPLRFVRSSSASLPPSVMADLEQVFKAPVIEAYGMTEAAHQMASNPLPPLPHKPGSVGRQAGPDVAIMDQDGNLLPAGQPGEIVIRGLNVMPGYHNNPSANAGAFTAGWFRTGDEGYFDPDGYLFITGRLKEMINRGGEKIAPREVDEVFLEHPAVAQVVTFAVRHPTLGEDIATAVTLRPGATADPKDLRRFALGRLAAHKAPSQVIILDQIPKGPTGKLQRIGLADRLADHLRSNFEPLEGDIEEILAALWREVLGEQRLGETEIGRQENFFAMGGDSLCTVQLIARIRSAFQVDLPIGSIFQEPTVAEQAELVKNMLLDELEALSEDDAEQLSRQNEG